MTYARAPPGRHPCRVFLASAAGEFTKEVCNAQIVTILRNGPDHVLDGQRSGGGFAPGESREHQYRKACMTDTAGKNQHTMDVAATAVVMRDGKTVALADLKPGDMITVTTEKAGNAVSVTKVDAKPAGM